MFKRVQMFKCSLIFLLIIIICACMFRIIFAIFQNNNQITTAQDCNHRDYGNGRTVCACSEQLGCDSLVLNISPVKGSVTLYRSSKSGDRFLREQLWFVNQLSAELFQSSNLLQIATVKLDRTQKYQKIVGFGGAFTDSTGINTVSLSDALQVRLIRDYFGVDGLEYRLGRVPIGGTDFSTRPYTYDDQPNDDDPLSTFSLQPENFLYKIPYLKQAQDVSPHQLNYFGTVWSPPSWMKTNNALSRGYLKGEPGEKNYKLYAKYLVRFLQKYNRNNITFWGLSLQNEPQISSYVNTPTTAVMNALLLLEWMERAFLKLDLGPALTNAGFEDIKVMLFDDNHCMPNMISITCLFDGFMLNYVNTILVDEIAEKYVAGIAFHWYSNPLGNVGSTLDRLAEKFGDKFLLSTEACIQGGVSLGNWANAEAYALDIIHDLNHHVGGWVDWNMVLDVQCGPTYIDNFVDSPIIVNATGQKYYKQPMYYALGHFTKFLVPDSVRIEHELVLESQTDINVDNFLLTTFERPENGTVMIVLNMNEFDVTLMVNDSEKGFVSVSIKFNTEYCLVLNVSIYTYYALRLTSIFSL